MHWKRASSPVKTKRCQEYEAKQDKGKHGPKMQGQEKQSAARKTKVKRSRNKTKQCNEYISKVKKKKKKKKKAKKKPSKAGPGKAK